MSRRTVIAVAGWLAAAVAATLIGVAAIGLIGESITGTPGGVLSEREVLAALDSLPPPASPSPSPTAAGPAPTASPTPSASASASPSPADRRSFAVAGGTAVAACAADGRAELVTWSAAQGWSIAKVERGPAREVRVEFEGAGGNSELRIRCSGGVPVQHGSGGDDD